MHGPFILSSIGGYAACAIWRVSTAGRVRAADHPLARSVSLALDVLDASCNGTEDAPARRLQLVA
jgi:hypothetical protein